MDPSSDESCQDFAAYVPVNHELKLREQHSEPAGPVVRPAAVPFRPHGLAHSFHFEHDKMHFIGSFNHKHSQDSVNHPTTTGALARSQTLPAVTTNTPTISSRRRFNFNLPPFNGLPRSPVADMGENIMTKLEPSRSNDSDSSDALIRVTSFPTTIRSPSAGPPTPPLDVELGSWLSQAHADTPTSRSIDQSDALEPAQLSSSTGINGSLHQSNSTLPAIELSTLNFAGTPWFQKALGAACKSSRVINMLITDTESVATIGTDTLSQSVKVISQILPMNASDQRATKTYEMICDRIQQCSVEPRTITITHARKISPGQVVEDFPKSPPSTPYHIGSDGYFGDQTIFTHVAEVPVHHDLRNVSQALEVTAQRHIMTAEASNIILERYIPPTTINETLDLFDANSCRSYLADRLPELAPDAGSMVFIYPTKAGAQTFAKSYVGPILDPLLREISILKGLNTNAAETLGRMKSIDGMLDFTEMERRLRRLCDSLNSRTAFKRTKTEFTVEHSDVARVILDRNTWMTWFVEQEQQRMKQDLVDYHREGGKLPETDSINTEVTAGMLSREVADGLRKSTKVAGDVGIEVGVFVIRRYKKQTTS